MTEPNRGAIVDQFQTVLDGITGAAGSNDRHPSYRTNAADEPRWDNCRSFVVHCSCVGFPCATTPEAEAEAEV